MKECKFSVRLSVEIGDTPKNRCAFARVVACEGAGKDREMCPFWNKKITEIVSTKEGAKK